MIDAQLMRNEGILIVSPVDKLEKTDFEQIKLLVNPYIEEHGGLKGLLIDAESFPFWEDFASMLTHFDFMKDYQKKIERVAAVTDNSFLSILPKVMDYFVSAEVRHFPFHDRDKARSWLRTGLDE